MRDTHDAFDGLNGLGALWASRGVAQNAGGPSLPLSSSCLSQMNSSKAVRGIGNLSKQLPWGNSIADTITDPGKLDVAV
jgi:hypothetical protein